MGNLESNSAIYLKEKIGKNNIKIIDSVPRNMFQKYVEEPSISLNIFTDWLWKTELILYPLLSSLKVISALRNLG